MTVPLRGLVQLVDEDRALLRKVGHNIAVMHDLFADINRRTEGVQCDLHDVDGPNDTGAEATRLEKKDPLSFRFVAVPIFGDKLKGGCSHVFQYTASTP